MVTAQMNETILCNTDPVRQCRRIALVVIAAIHVAPLIWIEEVAASVVEIAIEVGITGVIENQVVEEEEPEVEAGVKVLVVGERDVIVVVAAVQIAGREEEVPANMIEIVIVTVTGSQAAIITPNQPHSLCRLISSRKITSLQKYNKGNQQQSQILSLKLIRPFSYVCCPVT